METIKGLHICGRGIPHKLRYSCSEVYNCGDEEVYVIRVDSDNYFWLEVHMTLDFLIGLTNGSCNDQEAASDEDR